MGAAVRVAEGSVAAVKVAATVTAVAAMARGAEKVEVGMGVAITAAGSRVTTEVKVVTRAAARAGGGAVASSMAGAAAALAASAAAARGLAAGVEAAEGRAKARDRAVSAPLDRAAPAERPRAPRLAS